MRVPSIPDVFDLYRIDTGNLTIWSLSNWKLEMTEL